MKKLLISTLVSTALLTGGMAMAKDKEPVVNTSPKAHPNLNAAQTLIQQAFDKLTAAQTANEYDLDGHAKKAKDLLDEANKEIKMAATTSNDNKNKGK